MLHLGTNFSCKKFGLQRHNADLIDMKNKKKKTHLKYRSFLVNVMKNKEIEFERCTHFGW